MCDRSGTRPWRRTGRPSTQKQRDHQVKTGRFGGVFRAGCRDKGPNPRHGKRPTTSPRSRRTVTLPSSSVRGGRAKRFPARAEVRERTLRRSSDVDTGHDGNSPSAAEPKYFAGGVPGATTTNHGIVPSSEEASLAGNDARFRHRPRALFAHGVWLFASACTVSSSRQVSPKSPPSRSRTTPAAARPASSRARPADPSRQPIPLWKEGKVAGEIDAAAPGQDTVVLDLGEGPGFRISSPSERSRPMSARRSHVPPDVPRALARGEFRRTTSTAPAPRRTVTWRSSAFSHA